MFIPGALLVVAVGCTGAMLALRPSASKAAQELAPARVDVFVATAEDIRARVEATGIVEPSRSLRVIPEVGGRVQWVHEAAIPGGRIPAGETFARIDSRDYALRVEQARAQVRQAELELEIETGRVTIAKKEWELLKEGRDPSEAPLALRGPQLATAQQALASAKANLEQAELNLSRTRLVAPFDALVVDESLEVGQVVAPGAAVATLMGSESFWVTVSVPVDELGALELPGEGRGGSPAVIRQNLGSGRAVVRDGQVQQLRAQLDPQTRTAQLLLTVDRPLDAAPGEVPLLPGAYVDTHIEGRMMSGVVRLPRVALHEGRYVWLVVDGTLRRRDVTVGWREGDDVLVAEGLTTGDQVVVSPLSLPLDGARVEVLGRDGGVE